MNEPSTLRASPRWPRLTRPLPAVIAAIAATALALLAAAAAVAQQPRTVPQPPSAADEITALAKQGQLDRALERAETHLQKNPRDVQVRFMRGVILSDLKRPADAIAVFEAMTQDFPELPEPYNNLAVLHAAQGRYEQARSLLQRATAVQPNYVTAHENLGDLYMAMAAQAYEQALKLDTGNRGLQDKLRLARETSARLRAPQ
jgi:tetratricopeptide (TPR) repeat protein